MSSFGAELRRRRREAGLSLSQLAERVHYHKGYLSRIENGQKPPSAGLARLCDAELGAGGELRALASRPVDAAPGDLPAVTCPGDSWLLHQAPDQTLFTSMPDGDGPGRVPALVLQIGSEAVLAGPGVVSFASILSEYRKLGHSTGPAALLPGVISQARVLTNLARHAATPMRARLLDLAGQYAEYAGWLAQEAGDDRATLWWTDLAVELARQAGNRDMASHALIRKALVSMYRDDGRRTVELATRAQQDTAASPRIRGLAAQREAQGLALLGDDAGCRSALDRAEHLLAAQTPDRADSMLGPTSVPDPGPIAAGWCLLDLGRPAQAAEVLGSAIAAIPARARRSRARYGARQALAYSMAHEVDHACALACEVLALAGPVDSATIRIELRSLRRSLSRWSSHQPVRDIMPLLTDALGRGGLPSAP